GDDVGGHRCLLGGWLEVMMVWVAGGDGRMVVGADGRVVVDRQAVNGGVDLLSMHLG
ncbi:hypothetical protein Tco_1431913, partial [Tanacetum coccineum]